jgi:SecD/SecF fusion protein
VSASLGADSIRSGVGAGLLGHALTLLFVLFYYRLAGVVACLALAVNLVLLFGAMSMFNFVLTLPGIAGIILTIGMAIDANVLIFERIKEELNEKKTVQTAIANGFGKAFITIFDSNVTTLIAALFLLEFGSGPVRGFAVTLTVGLLASMFTAIFVSRMIYEIVIGFRTKSGKPPTTLSIGSLKFLSKVHIPFMKYRLFFVCLSLVFLAVCGWSYFTQHLNLGIDFRGGEEMQIRFNHPVEVRELEAAVREGTEGSLSLVRYGDPVNNEILIRMSAADAAGNLLDEEALAERGLVVMQNLRSQEIQDAIAAGMIDINTSNKKAIEDLIMAAFRTGALSGEDAQAKQLSEAVSEHRTLSGGVIASLDELKEVSGMTDAMFGYLSEKLTVGEFAVMRIDTVGPTVGEELKTKTWQAIIGALIGILLYIWFRFQFRFSLGAIVALVHDTLVAVGLVSLFQVEINLPTIAAFLTVVGYSTNDTIVVFDRIREHMKKARKQEDIELFDKAINETLSRTLITSLTTFFVVLCMLLFGGEVLFSFSFVLCVGIIVGTYSSIFVASPAVLLWNQLGLQKYFTRKKGKR